VLGGRTEFHQENGEGTTNIQAVNYYQQGIDYQTARQIAQDVFDANFYKLSEQAATIAQSRVQQFIDDYLEKLQNESPEALGNVQDPDLQYGLFTAQMNYARSGDKDLGDILIEMLVQRTKTPERSLKQLTLNEAITVVPKLNNEQIKLLALLFTVSAVHDQSVNSHQALLESYMKYIYPFIPSSAPSQNQLLHLEYSGCISVERIASFSGVVEKLLARYPGLFSKGFPIEDFNRRFPNLSENIKKSLLTTCLNNPNNFQINAIDEDTLNAKCKELCLSSHEINELKGIFKTSLMREDEVKQKLEQLLPNFNELCNIWDSTYLKSSNLTTVGIAIAYSYVKRSIDFNAELDIWLS
jgi:hypothetical protein